ncbi:hypothetical protein ISS30_05220 [bacterium]|nr:hypothetical protein [FCB group bacterium]MBL7191076.1 hypothetical protein [bacterium]
MNQKIYWMRRLELSKIRDLYILLHKFGPLKYSEIFVEGETAKIFVKEDGAPLAKTPRYHYLNNAYKLNMLQKTADGYAARPRPGTPMVAFRNERFGKLLNKNEKNAFRNILVNNEDCRKAFLRLFMLTDNFTAEQFIEEGVPVYAQSTTVLEDGKEFRTKIYRGHSGRQMILHSEKEKHAIEWGIKQLLLQCDLCDEVYIDPKRQVIYPLKQSGLPDFKAMLKTFLELNTPKKEWNFMPVNELIFQLAPEFRSSKDHVKTFLFIEMRKKFTDHVKFSEASKGIPKEKQISIDTRFINNYMKVGASWKTHLIVNKKLWEIAKV